MNVLFLDTSALLAIATDTAGRDAILTAFDCADVVAASGLALAEALPALDRLTDERYARVDLEDAVRLTWDYLHIVPLDARCTERAATLARERPPAPQRCNSFRRRRQAPLQPHIRNTRPEPDSDGSRPRL